jgi:hypothetical protein
VLAELPPTLELRWLKVEEGKGEQDEAGDQLAWSGLVGEVEDHSAPALER